MDKKIMKGFNLVFPICLAIIIFMSFMINIYLKEEQVCYEEINTKETLCESRFDKGILISEEKYMEEINPRGYGIYIAFGVIIFSILVGLTWFEKKFERKVGIGCIIGGIVSLIALNIFAYTNPPIWLFILMSILLGEIIFFLDKKKPKRKDNVLWFTSKRKGLSLFISSIILITISGLINSIRKFIEFIRERWEILLKIFGYVGIVIIILGAIWLFIWLNSLKYKR